MNKHTKSTVFFDFDGVIHNTFDFHLEHFNEHYDLSLSGEDLRSMHDGNFYLSTPKELEGIDWSEYPEAVKDEQGALVIRMDIKDHLENLSEKYKLFLVTSGFRIQTEPYLKNNDIFKYFTDELYREDSITKREKFERLFKTYEIEAEDAIFVTDTLGDLKEANSVGLRSIAVSFGFHDAARLKSGNPFMIVDSWAEIPTAITQALEKV